MKLYALSLAYLQYFFNWRRPLFLMHNNKWLWVLISTFYLISGWYDNFSLNQKEIPFKKILEVSQIHMLFFAETNSYAFTLTFAIK